MERFTYLLTFAIDVAETERLHIHYFIRGLQPEIGGEKPRAWGVWMEWVVLTHSTWGPSDLRGRNETCEVGLDPRGRTRPSQN
ncbi:hypothetical protein Syun_030068 [Stephania yunnanensis]|uniref:Uncharacterized protein n=1 Tax=Stephania yunnanensis TaxID=152371 RepID=A0AAP0HHV5_9MAGN